jgi:hypothetical protein
VETLGRIARHVTERPILRESRGVEQNQLGQKIMGARGYVGTPHCPSTTVRMVRKSAIVPAVTERRPVPIAIVPCCLEATLPCGGSEPTARLRVSTLIVAVRVIVQHPVSNVIAVPVRSITGVPGFQCTVTPRAGLGIAIVTSVIVVLSVRCATEPSSER